jgi:hypothetical protein
MIHLPAQIPCNECGSPAEVELTDTRTGNDCFLCREHKPDLWPGKNPHLALKRWRMGSENHLSRALVAPKDSREHKDLFWDLCEAGLLGRDGACRYYLSVITGIDQFPLWCDEFTSNVREFVISKTCPAASQFCQDLHSIQFLGGFLRRAWEDTDRSEHSRRISKAEKAVELLLHHPEWSDERIAAQVPTTLKQLQRFSDYGALRAIRQHQRKR